MILNKQLHAESLEQDCLRALAQGDGLAAFMFADRRCRVPPLAKAHHFVLRAEALRLLGEPAGALLDITRALEIAPEDVQANRRMLAWGRGPARSIAARVLVEHDRDPMVLAEAIAVLKAGGQRAVASIRVLDDVVAGWIAWEEHDDVELTIHGTYDTVAMTIVDEHDHPLRNPHFANFADFEAERPASDTPQTIALTVNREVHTSLRAPANAGVPTRRTRLSGHRGKERGAGDIAVIVPVYDDYVATRDCLDGLVAELDGRPNIRAILINDASPNKKITSYLDRLAGRAGIEIVTNAVNLGFVESVNHALKLTQREDVVLLNADTVVPPGFLDRLSALAHSAPGIGTITPLSNNGEFTSFPAPNTFNPMLSRQQMVAIDRIASRVNAGRLIDLPNGDQVSNISL
jgi:O-antigen biosynthesis protein